MKDTPRPPRTYQAFINRFPQIAQAWESIAEEGKKGPIDNRTVRLLKLAVSIGALREGAVHSNIRKAIAMGIRREEIEQVITLAAGTLGLPATVAVFSWVQEILPKSGK